MNPAFQLFNVQNFLWPHDSLSDTPRDTCWQCLTSDLSVSLSSELFQQQYLAVIPVCGQGGSQWVTTSQSSVRWSAEGIQKESTQRSLKRTCVIFRGCLRTPSMHRCTRGDRLLLLMAEEEALITEEGWGSLFLHLCVVVEPRWSPTVTDVSHLWVDLPIFMTKYLNLSHHPQRPSDRINVHGVSYWNLHSEDRAGHILRAFRPWPSNNKHNTDMSDNNNSPNAAFFITIVRINPGSPSAVCYSSDWEYWWKSVLVRRPRGPLQHFHSSL